MDTTLNDIEKYSLVCLEPKEGTAVIDLHYVTSIRKMKDYEGYAIIITMQYIANPRYFNYTSSYLRDNDFDILMDLYAKYNKMIHRYNA